MLFASRGDKLINLKGYDTRTASRVDITFPASWGDGVKSVSGEYDANLSVTHLKM